MATKSLIAIDFVIGLAASACLLTRLAPAGAGTDVFLFKDAGCNLSLGFGFTSFSLPGYMSRRNLFASRGLTSTSSGLCGRSSLELRQTSKVPSCYVAAWHMKSKYAPMTAYVLSIAGACLVCTRRLPRTRVTHRRCV